MALGSVAPKVDPERVTVYNMRFCPFAQRTILVLLEKNIPFDVVNINLKKKPDWFLNETWGLVSVVRYKNKFIMESLINSDFIDEEFGGPKLHPSDPAEKALGRLLVTSLTKMSAPYYQIMVGAANAEDRKTLFQNILQKLQELEEELQKKGSDFLGGTSVGMTDLMIWPWIERLPALDLGFPGEGLVIPDSLTSLCGWIKRMWQVSSVKQYGLDPKTHLKYKQSNDPVTGIPDYDMLIR